MGNDFAALSQRKHPTTTANIMKATTVLLGLFASSVTAQIGITLTPTTVCRGATCTKTDVPETVTKTVSVAGPTTTQTSTITSVKSVTATFIQTTTITATKTEIRTTTKDCGPARNCPTLTSTGTVCRSCVIPGCTTTVAVTKSCGCSALATTTVNFPCNDPGSCNAIGCKTVYDVQTQKGC